MNELPMPNGWFALLRSDELPRRHGRVVHAFAQRIELVRNAEGDVEGGEWFVHESGGLIFVHHDHAGRAPTTVPPNLDATLSPAWTRTFTDESDFRGHPIDVAENVADAGHFVDIHGAKEPATLKFEPDGARAFLSARFPLAKPVPGFPARLDIEMIGPGLLVQKTWLLMDAMVFTSTYPIAPGRTRFRIAVRVKKPWWLPLVPVIIAWTVFVKSRADTRRERVIWDNRRYLTKPRLSSVDRFVMPLRAWYAQFLDTRAP